MDFDYLIPTKTAIVTTKNITIVTTNSDLNEGRGQTVVVGYFVNESDAKLAGKGRFVMGTNCPVATETRKVVITPDGKMFLLGEEVIQDYEDPNEIRKRALAKLTPKEKQALGIEEE